MRGLRIAASVCATSLVIGCGFSFGSADVEGTDPQAGIRAPNRQAGTDAGDTPEDPPNNTPVEAGLPAPDAGAKDAAPVGPLKAFVSSTLTTGNLGGLAGADALCNNAAAAAGLSGKYTAWLSVAGTNAIDRITVNGPWQLVNGTVVAATKADLAKGSIAQRFDKDEKGQTPPAAEDRVWTATNANGSANASDCGGWTSTAGGGLVGEAERTGGGWTELENEACTEVNRVYCLQQQ